MLIVLVTCFSFHFAYAVEFQQNGKTLIPDKTTETIKIDGVLNENVWSNRSLDEDFKEYYPGLPRNLVGWPKVTPQ